MFEAAEANSDEFSAMNLHATLVLGRNMFGEGRGAWDLDWRCWWGEEPLYHAPVFVLSHHERAPLVTKGGTTFTFVTDGIQSALDQGTGAGYTCAYRVLN